jgi:hypothetical protein
VLGRGARLHEEQLRSAITDKKTKECLMVDPKKAILKEEDQPKILLEK